MRIRREKPTYGNPSGTYFEADWSPDEIGKIALELLTRWGMVAGMDIGREDTAGRAVMELMPVEEVVDRAVSMAKLFVQRLENDGLMIRIPEDYPKQESDG